MKKFFLGVFILFDIGLIGGSGYVLVSYIRHKMPPSASSTVSVPAPAPVATTPAAPPPKGAVSGLLAPSPNTESSIRKILFSYRNSKARQVSIRADFTGWKAEPMQKGPSGVWTYQGQLSPGEYAYCYTVDDKTFKDPANKRTKVIGRTTVSAIVVEALPAKAAK